MHRVASRKTSLRVEQHAQIFFCAFSNVACCTGTCVSYTNFDVTVGSFDKDFFISATLSGQGSVLGRFALPFRREELTEWSHGLNEKLAQEIGSALFEAVFQNEIRFAFQDALRVAARSQDNLRLRLNLDAFANRLPWELLFHRARGQFLALDEHLSIVRQPTILDTLEPMLVNFPLRVLIVTAQARDAEALDMEAEKTILQSAARELSPGQIALDWLEQPSLEQLRQTLQAQTYHILHFIGHGRFRPDADAGELQLVHPSGHGQWVTAAQLARIVRSERALRVVFLNACDSARSSSDNAFSGVAAELIRTGDVSAAIAMQFPITDRASLVFTRGFYQALLQSKTLDAAVTQGRLAVDAEVNHFEWATPALYLHAADGQLLAPAENTEALHLEPLRNVTHLYGRDADLERYRAALAARNFVIIEGMAGIGKTTLGAALAQEQRAQGRHVYWITFDAVSKTGGEVFLWEIAGLLRQHGTYQLWDFLQQEKGGGRQPAARFNLLLTALQSGAYTLCFDDLHLVQDDPIIQQLFVQIQKLFRGQPEKIPAKFIIMTRDVPEYMQYLERELLGGLDSDAQQEWLRQEGIALTAEELTRLDRKVEGNPQFLQLALQAGLAQAARAGQGTDAFIRALEAQRNVRDYLLDGMYVRLDENEKRMLDVLCIFDRFVPLPAVQAAAVNENVRAAAYVIEGLIRQNVVQEKRENGDVGLHALVRDWCYRNLDEDVKRRLHFRAGEYAEAQREFLAAASHYRRAGKQDQCARVLIANTNELLQHGGSNGLIDESGKIERRRIDLALWVQLRRARGEAFVRSGNEIAATESFSEALADAAEPRLRAELTERVAKSYNMRGDYAEAVPLFENALAQSEALGADDIAARANLGLANALTRLEIFERAIVHADAAIQRGQQLGNALLIAEAQAQRAIIALDVNDNLHAIQLLEECLVAFEKCKRTDLMADANLELGLAYQRMGNEDSAVQHYQVAVELYEKGWDLVAVASALNNLGDLEMVRGNYADAIRHLERARQLADEHDDSFYRVLIRYTLSDTYFRARQLQHAHEVLRGGLAIPEAPEYAALYAGLRRIEAQVFAAEENGVEALAAFERSLECLTKNQVLDKYEWMALYHQFGDFLAQAAATRARGCEYLNQALAHANELNATGDAVKIRQILLEHCERQAD